MIYILIHHTDGSNSTMQFVDRCPLVSLSPKAAIACGFREHQSEWVREPSEAAIKKEIERAFSNLNLPEIICFEVVTEDVMRAAPRRVEPPRPRKSKAPNPEIDLTPIVAALAAFSERLEITDKKADEASKQATKSLKYIDAINEGMGNVAEGRV